MNTVKMLLLRFPLVDSRNKTIRESLVACLAVLSVWMPSLGRPAAGQTAEPLVHLMFPESQRYVSHIAEGNDAGAIQLQRDARRIESTSFPIEGQKRYDLKVDAKLESQFAHEENDRAIQLVLQSFRYSLASSYVLSFFDKHGKQITAFGYGGRGFFISNQWQRYTLAFYTPPQATAMKIRFEPNGHTTQIKQVNVELVSQPDSVNLNPDFRYTQFSYTGWHPRREGRLYERPDGVVVLVPGYGGTSEVFPLSAEETYVASARGKGGKLNIVYYNEKGDQINSRFLLRPADGGQQIEFTPPEGTQFGRLLMYGVNVLEQAHIRRVPATSH